MYFVSSLRFGHVTRFISLPTSRRNLAGFFAPSAIQPPPNRSLFHLCKISRKTILLYTSNTNLLFLLFFRNKKITAAILFHDEGYAHCSVCKTSSSQCGWVAFAYSFHLCNFLINKSYMLVLLYSALSTS